MVKNFGVKKKIQSGAIIIYIKSVKKYIVNINRIYSIDSRYNIVGEFRTNKKRKSHYASKFAHSNDFKNRTKG